MNNKEFEFSHFHHFSFRFFFFFTYYMENGYNLMEYKILLIYIFQEMIELIVPTVIMRMLQQLKIFFNQRLDHQIVLQIIDHHYL